MAITMPGTIMTITMKTTFNNKNHSEDDDNNKLKNEFVFYQRISRYSKVIYFVYHYQNYPKTGKQG